MFRLLARQFNDIISSKVSMTLSVSSADNPETGASQRPKQKGVHEIGKLADCSVVRLSPNEGETTMKLCR